MVSTSTSTPASSLDSVQWSRELALVATLFALGLTWTLHPLFANPAGATLQWESRARAADMNLMLWILSWDWNALTQDPWNLLNANIHYPTPRMLLGAEHMLGYVPLYGPIYGVSGNPVLAFNATMLVVLVGAGVNLYALLRHWGVERYGAFFGAAVFAFSPGQLGMLSQLQLLGIALAPLVLIFLDRTLLGGRPINAVLCAVTLTWLAMCSAYLAYISASAIAAYCLSVVLPMRERLSGRSIARVAVAGLATAVMVGAAYFPYTGALNRGDLEDYRASKVLIAFTSHPISTYAVSPRRIRSAEVKTRGTSYYLGFVPAIAVAGCLLRRRRERRWAVWGATGVMMTGYVLSLGIQTSITGVPRTLPYAWLAEYVPGFSSMRVPGRFAILAVLGFACLAGIGFGRWLSLLPKVRARSSVGAVALVAGLVATAYDFDLRSIHTPVAERPTSLSGLPQAYRILAARPRAPVIEAPVGPSSAIRSALGAKAMYASIFHGFPLLNGYTGYKGESATLLDYFSGRLPGAESLELVQRISGLRYVIVNRSRMWGFEWRKWLKVPGIRKVYVDETHALLELGSRPEPDLLEAFVAPGPRHTTFTGTELRVLEPSAQTAAIESPPMLLVARGAQLKTLSSAVINRSSVTWPALAPLADPVVRLVYELRNNNRIITSGHVPLGADLGPGETRKIETPFATGTLIEGGDYQLQVGLSQGGDWFAARSVVEVRVGPPARSRRMRQRGGIGPQGSQAR